MVVAQQATARAGLGWASAWLDLARLGHLWLAKVVVVALFGRCVASKEEEGLMIIR